MCLFNKKKLLIIVGAGASVEFDLPSVSNIDKSFDDWSNELFTVTSQSKSLYKYLKDEIEIHFNSGTSHIKTETNFEEVLFTALSLYSLNNDFKMNPISAFYDFKCMPEIFDKIRSKQRQVSYNDFEYLNSYLIDKLLDEFRNKCRKLEKSKQNELNILKKFLSELEKDFDLGVLTFNYDNVFLSQLNNPITGFDKSGMFDPSIILKNKNWNFIYHIHGSVHFDIQSTHNGLNDITFKNDLNSNFNQNSMGRSNQISVENQIILTSSIIAGYGKSYQIQKSPFYLYFTDFARKVYEADAILFAGYGFNDIYINNVIAASMDYNRKRPVVVLTYSNDNQNPMNFRNDNWALNLFNCLGKSTMGTKRYTNSTPIIEDLKKNKEFEISSDNNKPISIWHNGFLEACNHPNMILSELKLAKILN